MINRIRAIAVAAALATLPAVASAQDKNQFEVGTKLINVGFILGDGGYAGYGSSIGAGAGLEVGVKDIAGQVRLGVGGAVGYARSTFSNANRSVTTVVGFVNGHYQVKTVPKLDLYAGPVIGFANIGYDINGVDPCDGIIDYGCGSDVVVGAQAGARWALTPKVLGWAQLSPATNLPFLSVGVSFKF